MSLYNQIFGINQYAGILLALLGTDPSRVPRFRDCYLSIDRDEIIIYTRTGGGNRPYYENPESYRAEMGEEPDGRAWNDDLRKLPGFNFAADDDFDHTYAYFHFAVADAHRTLIALLAPQGGGGDPAKRWRECIEGLERGDRENPDVVRALEIGRKIADQIDAAQRDPKADKIIKV